MQTTEHNLDADDDIWVACRYDDRINAFVPLPVTPAQWSLADLPSEKDLKAMGEVATCDICLTGGVPGHADGYFVGGEDFYVKLPRETFAVLCEPHLENAAEGQA